MQVSAPKGSSYMGGTMLSALVPGVAHDSPERQQQGRRSRGGASPATSGGTGKAGVKGDWETALDVWLPLLPSLS